MPIVRTTRTFLSHFVEKDSGGCKNVTRLTQDHFSKVAWHRRVGCANEDLGLFYSKVLESFEVHYLNSKFSRTLLKKAPDPYLHSLKRIHT